MAPYADLEVSPGLAILADVQRAAGLSRGAVRAAVDEGLVTPTPVRMGPGQGGGYTVTLDDALLLVACAALALAAGVAFVTMLRVLRSSGATIDPAAGAVVLPIPTTP
jgi:hypothetical protein